MLNIQPGHIARHTPKGAGSQGREAAIIDVAQDLLLRYLHEKGILEKLVFKGGTALRKLYAGNAGRFSLDLDFAIANIGANMESIINELIDSVQNLQIGVFRYGMSERRGKWSINYAHPFSANTPTLQSKLDINPSPWLPPIEKAWIPMPIHQTYGEPPLPSLKVVRLEENIAEKIARLNRATPARDLYDLRWIMTTPEISKRLDLELIRRVAVLKIWVDAHGIGAGNNFWKPGRETFSFEPEKWLRDRSSENIDIDDIGALAIPVPSVKELSEALSIYFKFLSKLTEEEKTIAQIKEQDRALVLKMLKDLPGSRLKNIGLY